MQAYDRTRCRTRQAEAVVGASDKSDEEIEIVVTEIVVIKNVPPYAVIAGKPWG